MMMAILTYVVFPALAFAVTGALLLKLTTRR